MTLRNLLVSAMVLGAGLSSGEIRSANAEDMVYELRTYTASPGKMPELQKRFRDHTIRIFEKHGIKSIGYWVPEKQPDTLVYLVVHPSRKAADKAWAAFIADPEWQKVFRESQKNGSLTKKVERVYLNPTDFSPLK